MAQATLITDPANISYITNGFESSNCFIIHAKRTCNVFTDARYITAAEELENTQKNCTAWLLTAEWKKKVPEFLHKNGITELLFEKHHISYRGYEQWKQILKKAHIAFKECPEKKLISQKRLKKTPEEIKLLKKAQDITIKTFRKAKRLLKPRLSEKAFAWKIQCIMRDLGADGISFDPIVAFGEHSAIPHHHVTDKRYSKKDVVLIDLGAKYKGYHGDFTRTILPKSASDEIKSVYNTCAKAQKTVLAALPKSRFGTPLKKFDELAREVMKKKGYDKYFTHSLGHGVGLEIHEGPTLSPKSSGRLSKNMVFSVEPGIYLPGKFGVRIEDLYFS